MTNPANVAGQIEQDASLQVFLCDRAHPDLDQEPLSVVFSQFSPHQIC